MDQHEKLFISLRYWLHGRNYMNAAEALHFAANYHQGVRKDGKTPEFDHQLRVTHYLRTLEGSLMYPEATLTTGILHDVVEDYGVAVSEIIANFGDQVGEAVSVISKVRDGVRRSTEEYYHSNGENPIASICKGGDRIHNHQSMPGVFSPEKQESYIEDESKKYILPMLKRARRKFPRQELAYENIKTILISQIELIKNTLAYQLPHVG